MSVRRHLTSTSLRSESFSGRQQKRSSSSSTKVLAVRNQVVLPVGAWVEVEQDFVENPSALALLTEETHAAKRRENEENLQRFQQKVRRRVAEHAHFTRKRQAKKPEVLHPCWPDWTDRAVAGGTLVAAGRAAQHNLNDADFQEPGDAVRQVRLRLAACGLSPSEPAASQLPGEEWSSGHKSASLSSDEEDEPREGADQLFTHPHECLLVKQKPPGRLLRGPGTHAKPPSDPSLQTCVSPPRPRWYSTDRGEEEEEVKKQHRSRFLAHRRLCMNVERRQAREKQQHRKHIRKTASIKAEKERLRRVEERRLNLQLAAERRRPEEDDEEEERPAELQRSKQEKEKVHARVIEALKAQLRERLSHGKVELPPLCLCASSFWDTHPQTCANNCFFHNNPRAYAKALHSTRLSFGVQ